ncbi:MAG: hypothetical protein IJ738_05215 [Alphaproteobacteria bacterium]|nr:hypothetical protein [Alphaproteobacteria bacterium]MBR1756943.1 hypothetical protein [Alphaproteobacteria bacterium]
MFNLSLMLWLLPLLGCLFVLSAQKKGNNAFHVTIFTLGAGVLIILRLFAELDLSQKGLQFMHQLNWLPSANIRLSFGFDSFSLLLLLGIYLSMLIGVVGLSEKSRQNKALLAWSLYFLWNIGGFLSANGMFSFYIYFAGMLIPLFMLIGGFSQLKKKTILYLFFLFNFAGVLILFCSLLLVYKVCHGNLLLHEIALMNFPNRIAQMVWGGVCLALLARIPIWPFHYWISSIGSNIKNPLVYICTNLLPLTGLYGFMRLWQLTIADSVRPYILLLVIFCLLSMLCIVLIGVAHKEFLYKLFAYMTVCYLLFLLAEVLLSSALQADSLQMNIAYSLFIFLIVTSSLVVIDFRLERECAEKNCEYRGILAYMPKRAKVFAFFVLVALGLPISSMFWNNFIIISSLFNFSFVIGIIVMFSISLIAVSMLYELYMMRDLKTYINPQSDVEDISQYHLAFFIGVIVIIFLSFFNPLWFVW